MDINNKEHKLDTLMLWWLDKNGQQEEDIASCDAVYSKNCEKYGFITEFDRTKKELLNAVNESIPYLDYIYVYTNYSSKKHELSKLLPDKIGLFSCCDTYGFGTMIGIQKYAKKL